ncbi:TetR/AcrR family transcriptional regulator [Streptomyces sp. NPDC050617]|uniref:TetR/AcrR family transcriptional regulator n=1 Tax=Streptomyces sp. NPDC050617 TaxID=3154628 RepID=UPI003430D603
MDPDIARNRLLDAAEELFYGRGVQAVGMDELRSASGVSLKRLYQLFPSKADIIEAYLRRRDTRWRESLAAYVSERTGPRVKVLAVFDWLHDWFAGPGFRGCAFINAFGELGAVSPAVATAAREHKDAFHRYLAELAADAGGPPELAGQLALLAEGAITTAAVSGSPEAARRARSTAETLLQVKGNPV